MFNIFKKQKKVKTEEVKVESVPVYETKEVEVYSRLTFAHNPNEIVVLKYFFVPENETRWIDVLAKKVFVYKGIDHDNKSTVYPVFKMPSTLPATKLVSNKKIICIGAFIVDNETNEIKELTNDYTGMCLEEFINTVWVHDEPINENTNVFIMTMQNVIKIEYIDGEVDLKTYNRSITLDNVINFIMTNDFE